MSVFPFRGIAKEALHAYKFGGANRLARLFAREIADLYRTLALDGPVVPVPPRRGGRRRRHDAVSRVAREVALNLGVRAVDALVRKGGVAQKDLDYAGRLCNLNGAFSPTRGMTEIDGRCVLIDDVFTTGATADECAGVLLAGGARSVFVLTVALD